MAIQLTNDAEQVMMLSTPQKMLNGGGEHFASVIHNLRRSRKNHKNLCTSKAWRYTVNFSCKQRLNRLILALEVV